jgi:hypothetical protein
MNGLLRLKAYAMLVYFDVYLLRGNFRALHNKVRGAPVLGTAPSPCTAKRICSAVDVACIWYPRPVRCLQRSAATACLLKRHGVPAQLVIGAQQLPFKAHAWVEVEGQVVNDLTYVREMYAVIDRC